MATDISHLEARYLNSCKKREVLPNLSILSSFSRVRHQKVCQEQCILEIRIDQLKYCDFPPLIDVLSSTNLSAIDAVDVCQESSAVSLSVEYVLSLFHAVNQKLRFVDLVDWSFWKDILRDICHRGIACQILNLRFSPIRKLNLTGKFLQLHTLNLDFSFHLTSFQISCFRCMPKLMHLSMCATRVANLWTTSAALSKLPSLVELRFQNCLCCYDTGPCIESGERTVSSGYEKIHSGKEHRFSYTRLPSWVSENFQLHSNTEEITSDLYSDDDSFTNPEMLQSTTEESLDESYMAFSYDGQAIGEAEIFHDALPELDEVSSGTVISPIKHTTSPNGGVSPIPKTYQLIEESMDSKRGVKYIIYETDGVIDPNNNNLIGHGSPGELNNQFDIRNSCSSSKVSIEDEEKNSINMLNLDSTTGTSNFAPEKHISHHPSPICFEKYYREYIISSLPNLKVLDNLPIKAMEREKAKVMVREYYEYAPYNRQCKESVVNILRKREVGSGIASKKSSHLKQPFSKENYNSFTRSLSAAKVSSSPWPKLNALPKFKDQSIEETKIFRPRQFEYHPSNPSLMVFGTLDGELVVINHESQKLVGYLPSSGALHSILGLCWLKKYPSKLIAGSDNGSLQLYDVCQMSSTITDRYCSMDATAHTFDEFEQLTAVHINSTDEYFLASGFSKHVTLYDIGSGKRLQIFQDLHQEHINVVKFSHYSPTIFATASFDQTVKMWDLRQGTSRPCFTAGSSRGNVMVCFSPDDHYLLASAVDNEVRQLLAVDGRLHTKFDIASTGSAQNYTRSYYMNGRDYIISGSCEENVVRICCSQTGRRLRDVTLEGRGSRYSMFVQSLRGDPFRAFHMSVLAAYLRPYTKSQIIKVNLLSSADCTEDNSCARQQGPSLGSTSLFLVQTSLPKLRLDHQLLQPGSAVQFAQPY